MQFSETITIDIELIDAIRENNEEKDELFRHTLNMGNAGILDLLNRYDYFDGMQGEVYNYDIEEGSVLIDTNGNGSFNVEYMAHHYYGCADLNKSYPYEMKLTFSMDFDNGEMELTGALWEVRDDYDNEFG